MQKVEIVASKTVDSASKKKQRSKFVELMIRMVKTKPLGTLGALITLILLLTGIFANFLAPYGMNQIHSLHALEAPSAQFLLGTDNLGRDLLSRIIFGARVSVVVGLSAALISTFISTLLGTISAYVGGTFDLIVQRFVDAVMCIPSLILLMVIISIIGTGMWQVIICLGISNGVGGSRMIRSLVISIKENTYVQSAVALGAPTWKILIQHILPNVMAQIIIIFTMTVPSMILAEAGLSFLGYGIRPPNASWGAMLSGSTRQYMLLAPWMALWPGLALSIIIYGVSMFGDALRDLLDPRLRGGIGRYGNKINKKKIAKNNTVTPEVNT
jgi:peptide/nickel transport system permease protein